MLMMVVSWKEDDWRRWLMLEDGLFVVVVDDDGRYNTATADACCRCWLMLPQMHAVWWYSASDAMLRNADCLLRRGCLLVEKASSVTIMTFLWWCLVVIINPRLHSSQLFFALVNKCRRHHYYYHYCCYCCYCCYCYYYYCYYCSWLMYDLLIEWYGCYECVWWWYLRCS